MITDRNTKSIFRLNNIQFNFYLICKLWLIYFLKILFNFKCSKYVKIRLFDILRFSNPWNYRIIHIVCLKFVDSFFQVKQQKNIDNKTKYLACEIFSFKKRFTTWKISGRNLELKSQKDQNLKMPSTVPRRNRNQQNRFSILSLTKITKQIKILFQEFFTRKNLWDLIVQPQKCLPMAIILFILEFFINFYIISYVKYTEIDWIAYMQEVEGVKNGK